MLRKTIKRILWNIVPRHLVIWRGHGQNRIALTFDDGPNPDYTPRVLEILRGQNARATFFLLGERVSRYPDLARQLVIEGHELGCHGFTHLRASEHPLKAIRSNIAQGFESLADVTGKKSRLYRPPHGILTPRLLIHCIIKNYTMAMWNLDSMDYHRESTDIIDEALAAITSYDGHIILFHDDNEHTMRSLERFIAKAAGDGCRFCTVSELIGQY